jgi:hypothetical protein
MFFTLRLNVNGAWRGNIELVHNDDVSLCKYYWILSIWLNVCSICLLISERFLEGSFYMRFLCKANISLFLSPGEFKHDLIQESSNMTLFIYWRITYFGRSPSHLFHATTRMKVIAMTNPMLALPYDHRWARNR